MITILIFSIWALVVIWSVGNLVSYLFRSPRFSFFDKFWLGTSLLIAIFQVWSIFKPTDSKAYPYFFCLVIINLATLAFEYRKRLTTIIGAKVKQLFAFLKNPFFLLFLYIMLATLFSAGATINWFDTYLYHLNAVRWIYEYPAIPGLVHIHSRLGINSGFFIFASFVEAITRQGTSSHTVLTLMVLVLTAQWIYTLSAKNFSFRQKIFCLLTLAPIINIVFRDDQFPSLSTDFAVMIVLLVTVYYLLFEKGEKALLALVLSVVALTVKVSALLFFPLAIILCIYYLKTKKLAAREFILSAAICAVLLGGFIARNVILTGWVIYPTPVNFGKVPVDWAATWGQNSALRRDITGWARLPRAGYKETLKESFREWFVQWYGRNQNASEFRVAFIGVVLFVAAWAVNRGVLKKLGYTYLGLLLTVVASLAVWLFAAPDIRFGSIYFWLLFFLTSYPYITFYEEVLRPKATFLFLVIYVALVAGATPIVREYPFRFVQAKVAASFPVEKKVITEQDGRPVEMWVPTKEVRCGNSELPCNPYSTPVLLRNPNNLSKGFKLKD